MAKSVNPDMGLRFFVSTGLDGCHWFYYTNIRKHVFDSCIRSLNTGIEYMLYFYDSCIKKDKNMTLDKLEIGKDAIICAVGGHGALRQNFLDM